MLVLHNNFISSEAHSLRSMADAVLQFSGFFRAYLAMSHRFLPVLFEAATLVLRELSYENR
jgi:hypothetical protein